MSILGRVQAESVRLLASFAGFKWNHFVTSLDPFESSEVASLCCIKRADAFFFFFFITGTGTLKVFLTHTEVSDSGSS